MVTTEASTSWISFVLVAVVFVLLVGIPGFVVALGARADHLVAVLLAPAVGGAVLLTAGLAVSMVGLAWTPVVGISALLVISGVLVLCGRLVRAEAQQPPPGVTRREGLGLGAGALGAAAIGSWILVPAVASPAAIPQTPDTMFHLFAIDWMAAHDSGSLRAVSSFLGPESGYYPGAVHVLAATLSAWVSSPATVAGHAVVFGMCLWVWPSGCMLLARVVLGRSPWILVVSGLTSVAFVSFPWTLLSWGALWPNILALALLPALMGLAVVLAGSGAGASIPWRTAATLSPLIAVGVGASHPNGLITALLLAYLVLVFRAWSSPTDPRRTLRWIALLAASAGVVGLALLAPESMQGGVRGNGQLRIGAFMILKFGPGPLITLTLTATVLVGCWALWRESRTRWVPAGLVASQVAFAAIYFDLGVLSDWVGWPWWHDYRRAAAMVIVVAVPCLTAGVIALAEWARRGGGPRYPATMLLVALIVVAGWIAPLSSQTVRLGYQPAEQSGYWVTPAELEDLDELASLVSTADQVAANPWRGGSYMYLVGGTDMTFPTEKAGRTVDRALVAARLVDLRRSVEVCAAVHRLGVDFVLTGGDDHETADPNAVDFYVGVDAVADDPGFPIVGRAGDYRLHSLPRCAD